MKTKPQMEEIIRDLRQRVKCLEDLDLHNFRRFLKLEKRIEDFGIRDPEKNYLYEAKGAILRSRARGWSFERIARDIKDNDTFYKGPTIRVSLLKRWAKGKGRVASDRYTALKCMAWRSWDEWEAREKAKAKGKAKA